MLVAFCSNVGLTPPDNNVHVANMGPIWDQQDPGGPHAGPMNFVIWADIGVSTTDEFIAEGVQRVVNR